MALIDHIDAPNRLIYLSASTVGASIHPMDLYREMRTLRELNPDLRPYTIFLKGFGNVSKGGGKATERYVQTIEGTMIVPFNTNHALTITGTIITDNGYEGIYCFNRAVLSPSVTVDINYVPPQVEVITIATGGALTIEEHDKLMDTSSKGDVYGAAFL